MSEFDDISHNSASEKEKQDYNYNYITITIKEKKERKKKYPILHIYIYPEFWHVHDKLKEIASREGKSISRLFWSWAERYVKLHAPGNPQQTLDHILKAEKPYRAPVQCEVCGAIATYKVLLLDKQYHLLCEKHFRMQVKQKHVLGWKKVERKVEAP